MTAIYKYTDPETGRTSYSYLPPPASAVSKREKIAPVTTTGGNSSLGVLMVVPKTSTDYKLEADKAAAEAAMAENYLSQEQANKDRIAAEAKAQAEAAAAKIKRDQEALRLIQQAIDNSPKVPPSFADEYLLAIKESMTNRVKDSRGLVDNADSGGMAAAGSTLYAVNSITEKVVHGFADLGRLFTNKDERNKFIEGMTHLLTTDPRVTSNKAWEAWSMLSDEERLKHGGAFIASLPAAVRGEFLLKQQAAKRAEAALPPPASPPKPPPPAKGVFVESKPLTASALALLHRAQISALSRKAADAEKRAADAQAAGNKADALKYTAIAEKSIEEARNILKPYVDAGDLQGVLARLDVSTPGGRTYFWSGWDEGAATAAAKQAAANGAVTLETTLGGRIANGWTDLNKSPISKDFWNQLSTNYADGSRGVVNVVHSDPAFSRGGGPVWRTYELPALVRGGNVNQVIIRDLNGNVREIWDWNKMQAMDRLYNPPKGP
jgi:hypothetical protein